MIKRTIFTLLSVSLFFPGILGAEESVIQKSAKPTVSKKSPKDAIKNGLKGLNKATGYDVKFVQKIGFCPPGAAQISQVKATRSYQGQSWRGISALRAGNSPAPFYVRSPKVGAGKSPVSQKWVRYTATAQGREIAQLYRSPEYHLGQAYKNSRRAQSIGENKIRIPVSSATTKDTYNAIQNSGCANGG
ncbi:MAG: hypothetical protein QF752_05130 [Planctomycetota bacterium]|jgi:hypothetical protein|nr:hypothetical protein [Planctomycetota bacterium]